ncbi:phytanoyl-CoA dioxygenase family protein [Cytobacillus pseudoceanisediminis]|uniref:phytanoyl-CoA dioxygenase family protein n=1 Tax=Cytobacillus pseudoceanisediminis TaxID=3051614 RepID=UPI003C2B1388
MGFKYLSDHQLALFQQQGFLVLRNVLNKEEVNTIKDEFEKEWLASITDGTVKQREKERLSSLYPNKFHVHKKSSVINKMMTSGRIIKIVEDILGEEALIVSSTAFYKTPGTGAMQPHQDEYGFGAGKSSCAIWVGLEEINEENGGLYFIPESHTLELVNVPTDLIERDSLPDNFKIVDIDIAAGDAIIIHPFVIHGSKKNSSLYKFRHVLFGFYAGASVQEIFENNEELMDKNGQYVKKAKNLKHMKKRIRIDHQPFWGV